MTSQFKGRTVASATISMQNENFSFSRIEVEFDDGTALQVSHAGIGPLPAPAFSHMLRAMARQIDDPV